MLFYQQPWFEGKIRISKPGLLVKLFYTTCVNILCFTQLCD
jgi:hypothetical protein